MGGCLSLAVVVFARLGVLSLTLTECFGILLRPGDDRRVFTGALQNHAADLLPLLSLDGTDHRRGCGPEWIFFAQGSEPLVPFGLAVADLIDVPVGCAECLLGVCAEGLFCLLALLGIGNILKLVVKGIHRELSGFFFGFRAGLVLLLRALERLHRVGIGLVAGATHGASCDRDILSPEGGLPLAVVIFRGVTGWQFSGALSERQYSQ